jgi:hypothetical protein
MSTSKQEFDYIINLIQNARSRVFSKAHAELVMLYFNIGYIVSVKVAQVYGAKKLWTNWLVTLLQDYLNYPDSTEEVYTG